MVVTILPPCAGFPGVGYNEKRVKNGEGKFLTAKNFDTPALSFLFSSPNDYVKYLKEWTKRNRRVKNTQMHCSISAKGKSVDPEELQRIGEIWLNKMGYGENPYLIYFHNNTPNNHIHIVTTRVNKNGMKVNDSYEKERAVRVLNEIVGVDQRQLMRNDIAKTLRFSFSSRKQYMLLLESLKYHVKEIENVLCVKKGADIVRLDSSLIDYCSKRYYIKATKKERAKLAGITYKYAQLLGKNDFLDYMRKKFGYDYIFFGKKDSPYGYVIIDNNQKKIYKGGEIVNVAELNELLLGKNINFSLLLEALMKVNPLATTGYLNKELNKYCAKMLDGTIVNLKTGEIMYALKQEERRRIKYNNVLYFCSRRYNLQTDLGKELISKFYKIEQSDFIFNKANQPSQDIINYYNDLIIEIANGAINKNMKEALRDMGIEVYFKDDQYALFDRNRHLLIENTDLSLSSEELRGLCYPDGSFYVNEQDFNLNEWESIALGIGEFIDGFVYVGGATGGSTLPKKRKIYK